MEETGSTQRNKETEETTIFSVASFLCVNPVSSVVSVS
jgi:hypothetical protein